MLYPIYLSIEPHGLEAIYLALKKEQDQTTYTEIGKSVLQKLQSPLYGLLESTNIKGYEMKAKF